MPRPLNINVNCTSSNYFECGGNVESLNTINTSMKINNVNLSFGFGADTSYKPTSQEQNLATNLAFEAKAKYNINKYLNTQARFRKIGDTEQYRVTFGGSYKLNENNSIYSSAHLTAKQKSDDTWSSNCGGWLGFTHNFENCSVSAEIQQNIPFKEKLQPSDTMVNLIATIPF